MIITNSKDLQLVLDFIAVNEILAFDIETTGLNPRQDKIMGFGISNEVGGYYITHLSYENEQFIEHISKSDCYKILEALDERKWVGWNSTFEVKFCRHYFGIDLVDSLWSDGMLLKHTIDEERPFALKEVGEMLYGPEAKDSQAIMLESVKKNGGTEKEYYKADYDLLGEYCIHDCLLTLKIHSYYLPQIKKQKLEDLYFKDEIMPMYKHVTINMEDRGILLDLDLINKTNLEITNDISILEDQIQEKIAPLLEEFNIWFLNKELPPKRSGEFVQYLAKYADLALPKTASGKYSIAEKALKALVPNKYTEFLLGGEYLPYEDVLAIQKLWLSDQSYRYAFNLSSKDHLKRLFYDRLEEEPLNTTDKGNPQVDDLFLDKMAEKYDWCELLRQYNKLNKLKGTYIDRFLATQKDGIFYPQFFQHRTVSGRLGSDIQQLPRPKEESELAPVVLKYNNLVRKFFIARPGYVFVDADYNSLEPHVFAHVSGDDGLKRIFNEGLDFYSEIAIKTEKLTEFSSDKNAENYLGKLNKPARQKSKSYVLGVPYGLGGYALSKKLNIDQTEGDQLVEDYLNAFPQLKKWMEKSFEDCVTLGFVRTESGRIRRFPKAPAIWTAHSEYILDSLKLWKKYSGSPAKYKQMKYLRSEIKNYINNARNIQIQGLAASITNRACIAISKELQRLKWDAGIVAQIHDQIIVEVPENVAERAVKIVQYLMENSYKISLKLKAPASIAKNFYEGH